ncbi:MAG: 1,3-beta-galactosyl-N-acetylhexosamine phosphorylase [Eubacteriales bacterium]|nr:1,3-beta-galactosyl-N-acetylhexosamine phosphorylase [Eubacteriales bacterium]
MNNNKGRLTIPTDIDVVPQTVELMERWGADAVRDCDGTEFPIELRNTGAKVYKTYYTTRKDNAWAKANPEEVQQCYIMTGFYMTKGSTLSIPLMQGVSEDMMAVNERDNPKRWWEVIDRTTGEIVSPDSWTYQNGSVNVLNTTPYHEYTVSFLAYLIWDPVHMYNAIVNDWQGVERQITFDVRQPKTHEFSLKRLDDFLNENPYVDVVRFTTFFHQFTLVFDALHREKYVDWYGYSASVSPYILEKFEKEVGYPFRAEYIIDQGYYNNQYRVPSKEYKDFMLFQMREVASLAKELVDIVHKHGKEAMMFLGDHFIGTEPYMEEFARIGLDAVVGSVGNGSTLRLISDIPNVKYTEGRLLPYLFPDTFYEGGNPVKEAKENWVTARRAILRKPVDRIGYGGYLKLALQFPDFVKYVESVAEEFRSLYTKIASSKPYCLKRVAVLNCWGKMRSWGCHMVHHALYKKENYSYAGVIEVLSGAPLDVSFISFEDIANNPTLLQDIDVVITVGDGGTAHTGGTWLEKPEVISTLLKYVDQGGGIIGVGEPTGHQYQGRFIQLASVFGIEKETGFTLGFDKYNWEEHRKHFILDDVNTELNFGEPKAGMYALEGTQVLCTDNQSVQLATNSFGQGRAVYISGLPYSLQNARTLLRAVMWAANDEAGLKKWYSENYNVDVHAYTENGFYCVVNNTYEVQDTVLHLDNGKTKQLSLQPNEILWFEI